MTERPEEVRSRVGILTETPGLYEKLSATANLDFFGRLYGLDADDPGRAGRALPSPLLPVGPARRRRRQLQQGHEAEAGDRPRPAPRAGGRLPRRADGGARPGGGLRRARGHREPAAVGRTIVLATHNLDEADRLCDRVAFVRGGLLRVDSPAGLRDSLGGRGVEIGLAEAPRTRWSRLARAVPGVTAVEVADLRLVVATDDPGAVTPALVRALVGCRRGDRHRPRARHDPRAGLFRRHGRPARPRRGRLMRAADRDDHPPPRVVRDHSEPAADVDHPHPAGDPHHRPACPGGSRGEPRAPAGAGHRGGGAAAGMGGLHGGRARRGVRRPAVPGVLPADAGLYPAFDRDVLDHRREAGANPGARAGDADPYPRVARRQGDRCAGARRPRGLGHVRRLRRARVDRLWAEPVRRRHRFELAGRRVHPGAGGRAVVGRRPG